VNNDQRTSTRHEFRYDQLVALVADGNMPSLGDFFTVPCEDVSCNGIAFFLENEPTPEEYVVALGKPQNLTFVFARAVQVRQVLHNGQLRYRVGCQFTGRARIERSTLCVVRADDDSGEKSEPPADRGAAVSTVSNVQKGDEQDG
jgi:hypothetical protein